MHKHVHPTVSVLRELLEYDPETGTLIWRPRDEKWFSRKREFLRWNSRYSGMPALTALNSGGYQTGAILGVHLLAHRVGFAIQTGDWPPMLDHINGHRTDNRFANLRAVTTTENRRNCCIQSNNTSGHVGVSWHRNIGKWQVSIRIKGRSHYFGYFSELSDAVAVRKQAERDHGFHANHGRKAA